jgi:hypothetical protein
MNPAIVTPQLRDTWDNEEICQQKVELDSINPSMLHGQWVIPSHCRVDVWNCTVFGTMSIISSSTLNYV